jgi:hypothetical protein
VFTTHLTISKTKLSTFTWLHVIMLRTLFANKMQRAKSILMASKSCFYRIPSTLTLASVKYLGRASKLFWAGYRSRCYCLTQQEFPCRDTATSQMISTLRNWLGALSPVSTFGQCIETKSTGLPSSMTRARPIFTPTSNSTSTKTWLIKCPQLSQSWQFSIGLEAGLHLCFLLHGSSADRSTLT